MLNSEIVIENQEISRKSLKIVRERKKTNTKKLMVLKNDEGKIHSNSENEKFLVNLFFWSNHY